MRWVIGYLLLWLAALVLIWNLAASSLLPEWLSAHPVPLYCALMGALGGVVYCLRAVYLNRSVHKRWDADWQVWYFLRPLVSLLVGGVSFLFLHAGLLVLDAGDASNQQTHGYLALAFIAGLNVDRFLARLEDLAQSKLGIQPSRVAAGSGQSEGSEGSRESS
jgi:hypothetical protein